jgi:4-hydroxy-tetrahydrodipicolinate reductase
MINLVVGGATGKLGRIVCDLAAASEDIELVGAVVSGSGGNVGKEICPGIRASSPDGLSELLDDADVYVDLTSPKAASAVIADIPATGTNLVLGTTAVDEGAISAMAENVSKYRTSALVSANFSRGVNVFWNTCETLAASLPGYDIEVIEAHHGSKEDAPSGTALETVKRLQKATGIDDVVYGREGAKCPKCRDIGVHSIRAGDIVGDHTVLFAKNMETIELTHRTISREVLAQGCLESVRWIAGKKDGKVHYMNEVLGL